MSSARVRYYVKRTCPKPPGGADVTRTSSSSSSATAVENGRKVRARTRRFDNDVAVSPPNAFRFPATPVNTVAAIDNKLSMVAAVILSDFNRRGVGSGVTRLAAYWWPSATLRRYREALPLPKPLRLTRTVSHTTTVTDSKRHGLGRKGRASRAERTYSQIGRFTLHCNSATVFASRQIIRYDRIERATTNV